MNLRSVCEDRRQAYFTSLINNNRITNNKIGVCVGIDNIHPTGFEMKPMLAKSSGSLPDFTSATAPGENTH